MLDFNDAGRQRGSLIPDGTYCSLRALLRPGGENMPGCSEHDLGIFRPSPRSDAIQVEFELTALPPSPHAGCKFFQMFTVAGGKVGEDGVSKAWNISKSTMRAMIDSALGLDPKDMSEAAKAKRSLRGFRDLDGIEFFAKIGIKPSEPAPGGGVYPDKNVIAHVVVPGEAQYAPLKAGQEVPPAPSSRIGAPTAAPVSVKPAWQQEPSATSQPASAAPQGPAWLRGEQNQ